MILNGQTWHHRLPTLPDHQVRVRVLNGAGSRDWPGRPPGGSPGSAST